MNLNFGTLVFSDEEEYYTALGIFCNNKAFSISYEPNKSTGSYADAYRMRKLSTACKLIKPIEDAIRSGNRINCNSYVDVLMKKHNFVQSGKTIRGTLENVIDSVPSKFKVAFIEGYTSAAVGKADCILVYDTESIKDTATKLIKKTVPATSRSAKKGNVKHVTSSSRAKTKHDFIKDHIKNIEIGERGEKLVFEHEREKLKNAVKKGQISSMDNLLKWVSLEDDTAGYDILSYDLETEQPIYIEVKSTIGNKFTPFYMSEGEINFSRENANNYRLYRIYNLKKETAEYFELIGDISHCTVVHINSINYEVTLVQVDTSKE